MVVLYVRNVFFSLADKECDCWTGQNVVVWEEDVGGLCKRHDLTPQVSV